MKAIILAGGFGTRLRPVIGDDIPKCMVRYKGEPFIKYVVANMEEQGIKSRDITLALHYKANIVRAYLGENYRYTVENEPLGTGGAIKNAISDIDPVLVVNGDTIHDIDYNDMAAQHRRQLTIAVDVHKNSAGVYILTPTLFKKFTAHVMSFEKDVIPKVTFSLYPVNGFIDIGTPEDYAKIPKEKM